ncbi:MAG: hypothetical protein Pg6A_19640 [Termitinemataceae bacterium]|nr:MAG: hypothetical protein Pg6A_19640 [Termitinemataceae bacterium]
MNVKTKRVFGYIAIVLCMSTVVFSIVYNIQSDRRYSDRVGDLERQLSDADRYVATTDRAVAGVRGELESVKAILERDTRDLKGYANKLREIAKAVKAMEDILHSRDTDSTGNRVDSGISSGEVGE